MNINKNIEYIMQTRSYKKSKLIRLGPYLQTEIIYEYSVLHDID